MRSELDVKLTVGFGISVFVIAVLWKGVDAKALFDAASAAMTATVIVRGLFVKWLWKVPFLEFIHKVPHIAGHWEGSFESTYKPAPTSPPATGKVEVKITQPDIFRVKLTQRSGESVSYSYGEEFEYLDDGSIFLNFSYHNIPNANVRDRSQISYGSARYHLERKSTCTLKGNYWTDRKTTGQVNLTKQ